MNRPRADKVAGTTCAESTHPFGPGAKRKLPAQASPLARDGAGKHVARHANTWRTTSHRSIKPTLCLVLAIAAIAPVSPISPSSPSEAQASTNVVSNPGFELSGCNDTTPVLCGWRSGGSMSQDGSNPHSGGSSLHLDCGDDGCYSDLDMGASISASASDCIALGPGAHAASFWYRDAAGDQVSLDASFYWDRGCSDERGRDSLVQAGPSGTGWHQRIQLHRHPPAEDHRLHTYLWSGRPGSHDLRVQLHQCHRRQAQYDSGELQCVLLDCHQGRRTRARPGELQVVRHNGLRNGNQFELLPGPLVVVGVQIHVGAPTTRHGVHGVRRAAKAYPYTS